MDFAHLLFYRFFILLTISPTATGVLVFFIVILFTLSFFVAGSEVAFFSMSQKDLNKLKTMTEPGMKRIVNLLEQPKTLLATMLIANSFVNIGIVLISNILLDNWIEPLHLTFWLNFFFKLVFVTVFLVLFGEVLPKVWATNNKIWFASTSSIIIEVFDSLFLRISKKMVGLSNEIEKGFSTKNSLLLDSSQLDYAIDLLPENEATIEEKQILKGIRKFGDTTVRQIMRTRLDVNGINYNLYFREVLKKIEDLHYSRLPVYKNNLDEIVGIIHTKDFLAYVNNSSSESFDWHKLIRPPYFVYEHKLIEDLLQEFRTRRNHLAVVVDEFGGTSGIVTLEDIIEEITGEIKDEFDEEEISNKKIDEFTYIFEGKTMMNDVCKTMKLPGDTFEAFRGDSNSLAGLVLEIAGEFPQENEEVDTEKFIFIPLEIHKNRLIKIKVIIKPESKQS